MAKKNTYAASIMLMIATCSRIVLPLSDKRDIWDAGGTQDIDKPMYLNLTSPDSPEGIHFYTSDDLSVVMDCITEMSRTRKEELFSAQWKKVLYSCKTENGTAHFRSRRAAELDSSSAEDDSPSNLDSIRRFIWGLHIPKNEQTEAREVIVTESDSTGTEYIQHDLINYGNQTQSMNETTGTGTNGTENTETLYGTSPFRSRELLVFPSPSKLVEVQLPAPMQIRRNTGAAAIRTASLRQTNFARNTAMARIPLKIREYSNPVKPTISPEGRDSGQGHGHSGGYGHSGGHSHSSGYGHDAGYGKAPKYKPANYKGPAYSPYDFLPEGKAKFSKKVKYGDDPVKESQKGKYQQYDKPNAHFGGFGGGGSHGYGYGKSNGGGHGGGYGGGHAGGYGDHHSSSGYGDHGKGNDDHSSGYGDHGGGGHDQHEGGGYEDHGGGGYGDDHGGGGYGDDHGGGGYGDDHGGGGYGGDDHQSEYKAQEYEVETSISYEPPVSSYEAPTIYSAPAPSYSAPSPSYAQLAYSPPTHEQSYAAPAPSYSSPGPAPTYEAPAYTYSASAQTYDAPAPTYGALVQNDAPASTYSASSPTYEAPASTYSAPAPTYSAPAPSYSPTSSTYETPLNIGYEQLDDPYNTYNPHDDPTVPEGQAFSYARNAEDNDLVTKASTESSSSGTYSTDYSQTESSKINDSPEWKELKKSLSSPSDYPSFLKPKGLQPFEGVFEDLIKFNQSFGSKF